jgi:hypothetical protein
MSHLKSLILQSFSGFDGLSPSFFLQYEDDEGDLVTVMEDMELEEALRMQPLPVFVVCEM